MRKIIPAICLVLALGLGFAATGRAFPQASSDEKLFQEAKLLIFDKKWDAALDKLQEIMVGLRGRNLREKYELYKEDMRKILSECSRVLRRGRFCTIIVGTNVNQLSKALEVPLDDVPGLHEILVEMALPLGLKLARALSRSIVGISNTMRREYILLLQRI